MKKIAIIYALAAALVSLPPVSNALWGGPGRHDIVVEKGQVLDEDVATEGSITVDGVLHGDAVSVGGGPVVVNGEVSGDVVSIGGPARITGRVRGDVSAIGGPVDISGTVDGGVSCVGAGVGLAGTAVVKRDVSVVGGSVNKADHAVLGGEVRSFDMNMARNILPRALRAHRSAEESEWRLWPWLAGGIIGLGLLFIFSLLATGAVLLLLPAVFFPKQVANAAEAVTRDAWRSCGVGALIVAAFVPVLLMLVISIMGIPLVPFALMLYAAAGALGLSAFSVALQARFFEGIKKRGPAGLPGQAAAGYALMAGLIVFGKLIPFIGAALSLIGLMLACFGTMMGLGAVWLTRMGNRPPEGGRPAQAPLP